MMEHGVDHRVLLRTAEHSFRSADYAHAAVLYAKVICDLERNGLTPRTRPYMAQASWCYLASAVRAAWAVQELPDSAVLVDDDIKRTWSTRQKDRQAGWDGHIVPPPTADGIVGAVAVDTAFARRWYDRACTAEQRTKGAPAGIVAEARDWCRHLAFHFADIDEFWRHTHSTKPPPGQRVFIDFKSWCGCECDVALFRGLGGGMRGPKLRVIPPPLCELCEAEPEQQSRREMNDAPKYISEIAGQRSGLDSDSQWGPNPATFVSTTAAVALMLLAWAIHTLRAQGGLKMLDAWLSPSDMNMER